MADGGMISAPGHDLAADIGGLFPLPVTVAALRTDPHARTEYAEEAQASARMLPARRAEFLTGRRALRQALAAAGIDCGAIPVGACRAPVLPRGVAASLSHTGGLCVAVASQGARSIGVDIEGARPLQDDLWPDILTPGERARLAEMPANRRGIVAMQVFTCKEALYKAQFPLTGQLIGFDAVDIALAGTVFTAWFRRDVGPFRKGSSLVGRTALAGRFVLSGVVVEV